VPSRTMRETVEVTAWQAAGDPQVTVTTDVEIGG
jgi:hypothetical protein